MTFSIPKLTKEQAASIEKNRRAVHAFEKRVADTPEIGVGSTSKSVEGATHIVVTDAQRAERGGFRSGNRIGLTPAHIRTKPDGRLSEVVFTPSEYAAWLDGLYCAWCWTLQREPEMPDWVVSASQKPCDPVAGPACSFPRGREARERVLPYKVSSTDHYKVA